MPLLGLVSLAPEASGTSEIGPRWRHFCSRANGRTYTGGHDIGGREPLPPPGQGGFLEGLHDDPTGQHSNIPGGIAMFRQLGIRARLLFAFFGISMFAVLAAAAALYSFLEVGKIIDQISEFEAPAAMGSLELSRQAEQMVGAAPALLTVATEEEREQIWAVFSAEGERLDQMMLDLKAGRGSGDISVDLIG